MNEFMLSTRPIIMVAMIAMLAACGKTETVRLIPGQDGRDGDNGQNGKNGHSLVSQVVEASEFECPTTGSRLDIYLDLNDSLTPDEGDQYLNSLIACNGRNGIDGVDGVPGSNGRPGRDGRDGRDGEQGIPGLNGNPGLAGIAGPPGLNGNPGRDGEPGPVGPAGPTGPQGAPGAKGSPGQGAVVRQHTNFSCTLVEGGYYLKTGQSQGGVGLYLNDPLCSGSFDFKLDDVKSTFWLTSSALAIYVGDQAIRIINFN